MTIDATVAPPETGTAAKTAATRLLDLLAGWSAYVSADEESGALDPSLPSDEIGALYQVAGELGESWDALGADEQETAVTAFVTERILPLLTRS